MKGGVRLSGACRREHEPCKRHERNQRYRFDLRLDLVGRSKLLKRERIERTVSQQFCIRNLYPSGILISHGEVTGREEEGKTFDMIVKGVRKHLVRQFGHCLADRGLEYIVGGSADSGLTKPDEKGGFRMEAEGSHLIVYDLLFGIVFQRRHELDDVGVLWMPGSVPGVTQDERTGNWLTVSSGESPVPSKQRMKVRPLGCAGSETLGSEIHLGSCWEGGVQVRQPRW